MGPTIMGPTVAGPPVVEPTPENHADEAESREWGVPPFEPLSIHTAEFDEGPIADLPMSATAEALDDTPPMDPIGYEPSNAIEAAEPAFEAQAAWDEPEPDAAREAAAAAVPARAEPAPAVAAPAVAAPAAPTRSAATAASPVAAPPNTSETQRIVTVRVCAPGAEQWRGADLLAALEDHGLGYGRYKVFHRKHSDGRTLFCAASLVEPGTFDLARMPVEEFRGLTLFAVLPGPADALETIDTLIATAMDLADTLHGVVQDAKGAPLSAARAEALREDVAHFQQSLSMS